MSETQTPQQGGDTELLDAVFGDKREALAERLTLMLVDLGGLTYEMAIRNHFKLEVLVERAAQVQEIDGELGQVDRLLSLGRAGAAGDCPNCRALFARGAAYCANCGAELARVAEQQAAPHVAEPHEQFPAPPGVISPAPPSNT